MRKIIFLVISAVLLYSNYCLASDKEIDILSNKAVEFCISKFGDNNIECLGDINVKSEKALKDAYEKKLKNIKSFDYTQWWMGSEEQKNEMIAKFESSQKAWISYRDIFCQVAVTGAQNTHDLGNVITSCILNMNSRRINEISLTEISMAE